MNELGRVLIADKDSGVSDLLSRWLEARGYRVSVVRSARRALECVKAQSWDVALIDAGLASQASGEFHSRLRQAESDLALILMIHATMTVESISAMREGTSYYLKKPLDEVEVAHVVRQALSHKRTREELAQLKDVLVRTCQPPPLWGNSRSMRRVLDSIRVVAPTRATVLITGERGSGKELVARWIHHSSPRQFYPLVIVRCGAPDESLVRGDIVFRDGYPRTTIGRIQSILEEVAVGTVLLDEVSKLTAKGQEELLRVLQTRRVAGPVRSEAARLHFRYIATTSKRLESLVEHGQFNPALFSSLNAFSIELLPLRERPEDVALLLEEFVRKFSLEMNKEITGITPSAVKLLQQQFWQGNVRELCNVVERAVGIGQGPFLKTKDFALRTLTGPHTLEQIEKLHILEVLEQCDGNQSQAAKLLDIDRVTLYHKMKKYGWARVDRKASDEDAIANCS